MQFLKQIPKKTLSFTIFPLALSITYFIIESFSKLFGPCPDWQPSDQLSLNRSLESFLVTLLRSIRGLLMGSCQSHFNIMGIMITLLIAAIITHLSRKSSSQCHPAIFSENRQEQGSINQENSFQKQTITQPQCQYKISNSKNKCVRFLLYFTLTFSLCQFITGSLHPSRSIFVGARDIKTHNIEQFHHRMLEESQQPNLKAKAELQDDPLDRLPTITKTQGAISFVVSQDGNKVFQISETITPYNTEYALSGMDITDPLSIKYYPPIEKRFTRPDITLLLTSDAKTLFVVAWGEFHIYNISHIYSAPKYVSSKRIPRNDSSANLKPAAVLYEEKNLLIIANNNFHTFNVSDYSQPVHIEMFPVIWMKPHAIALLPEREMVLLGSQEGLRAFDISDPNKPLMKKRILEGEFVFSISITSNKSTAIIGVLNKTRTDAQKKARVEVVNANLSILYVDLKNIESSLLPYSSFISIDQLKTCRVNAYLNNLEFIPDMKMIPDSKYAYWACDKDYGYIDIAKRKISRLLNQKTINTMALAQNNGILLKADSDETNFYALYQNIQKADPFIWKPVSISRLKLDSEAQILTSKNNRIVDVIKTSSLQIFNTSENTFSEISTIDLETQPLSLVPSRDGNNLYIKTDENIIQVYNISNRTSPQKLASIDFLAPIDDDFIVFPQEQMIFATQRAGQSTTIVSANISNPSSPLIDYPLIESQKKTFPGSAKLILSPSNDQLLIWSDKLIFIDVSTLISGNARVRFSVSGRKPDSLVFSPNGDQVFMIESDKNLNQNNLTAFNSHSGKPLLSFPVPDLAGNLPLEVSNSGNFVYLSTPEHLMEINTTKLDDPVLSRLMKINLKQFSLTGDGRFIYAVIEDYLEIFDVQSKYSLTSFKEDFPLGASHSLRLQLLERTGQSKWEPVYKKHKFFAANFYKASIVSGENEPVLSYSMLPNWINFDKETAEITIESRLPTHLGTYKMFASGSFQIPSPSKLVSLLPFLYTPERSETLIAELTDKGYLDEERFLTARYNPYKKLTLNSQNSQYESEIRYFLRNYATDQEFAFSVSSSLFLHQYPFLVSMETQSPHYSTARIILPMYRLEEHHEIIGQFVQRTYSSSRSILNQNQTDLTLDGTFININDAFKEVIIDIQEPYNTTNATIIINDNLNFPVKAQIDDVTQYFRINAKPIANSDQKLSFQSQVNKYSFVSAQSFSINLDPKSYIDVNGRPLEYSLLSTELDWLEMRGLTLTGTPPRKLWSSQVSVTVMVSNEFKSEKVTFTLNIGMSAVIVLQYVILYFGYLYSGYKVYQNLHKFYNISAQKFYRYPKVYQIAVNQEVTDAVVTPIGFFGKEFENANLLMNYLKRHFIKNSENKKFILKDFIDYFQDEQGHRLDKTKLITTINQVLEGLTFVERYSVKYYTQVGDDHRDIIHRIILDKIILSQINLSSEKQTSRVFKKIRDQWIDLVELEDSSFKPYFKVNKSKLSHALQSIDSKIKPQRPQKDGLLDITQSSVRSRILSNSHFFEKSANNIEESLVESSLNDRFKNVNIDLLELAIQAHAFRSHHLNALKEQITIVSNERTVGSSCFYKIKALFRKHLQKLQFTNKEDLGYGLNYVFKKNVLHFGGIPEASMEYETLVVQILNKREMIMREIYLFGAENKNRKRDHAEQVQEQL